jgi:hypothetical protein
MPLMPNQVANPGGLEPLDNTDPESFLDDCPF